MSDSIKGYKDYINEFLSNETNKQIVLTIENELESHKVKTCKKYKNYFIFIGEISKLLV